jgi:protoporphyrinogen oxidase
LKKVIIVGGGYTGLAAAYELVSNGFDVTVIEADTEVGGLAGSFKISEKVRLEKFYHHWFTSDTDIMEFIKELGLGCSLEYKKSSNGLFFVNSIFRLSSPLDLLKFSPLPFIDRIRTGLMALYARKINSWDKLEDISAKDWIKKVGGKKGYELIWAPLLQGKFGKEAENVSAVWFWNKLKLRGSSRGKNGGEELVYFKGGFDSLTNAIYEKLKVLKVKFILSTKVESLVVKEGVAKGVKTADGELIADFVLSTIPLPEYLKLSSEFPTDYIETHSKIRFLGNVCLILRLNRSLSNTYWLNVADPTFPFVGIIEHTNFDPPENYEGNHIAYISKYLPTSDELFSLDKDQFFKYCIPYIKKIFPDFSSDWVEEFYLWKAHYSQPVITKRYSKIIPPTKGPFKNLFLATMAQIYPEDRGTNYAIRQGRGIAKEILAER